MLHPDKHNHSSAHFQRISDAYTSIIYKLHVLILVLSSKEREKYDLYGDVILSTKPDRPTILNKDNGHIRVNVDRNGIQGGEVTYAMQVGDAVKGVFISASSALTLPTQKGAHSLRVGGRYALGLYQTELSLTSGNNSFAQAVVSRHYMSGSFSLVGLYDGTTTGIFSASKNVTDTANIYGSLTGGSSYGIGVGANSQGLINNLNLDAKFGHEVAMIGTWSRKLFGYIVRIKGGLNNSLGGILGLAFTRKLSIGSFGISIDVNQLKGVSLVIK